MDWRKHSEDLRKRRVAQRRRRAMILEEAGPLDVKAIARDCPLSSWEGDEGRCRWCNVELTGRRKAWCSDAHAELFNINHVWNFTRWAALRRDGRRCVRCGWAVGGLEVNHIVPVLGKHIVIGCHHHLAGVVTLCRTHHLEETARQRRNGEIPARRTFLPPTERTEDGWPKPFS